MTKTEADYIRKIKIWSVIKSFKERVDYRHNKILENEADKVFAQFIYKEINKETGKIENFDYVVPLVTTPCFFGGHRYWFLCPLISKKGVCCGRRVGVLYKLGNLFGCRHCHDLSYVSKNLRSVEKIYERTLNFNNLKNLKQRIKRFYYNGKRTKKFLCYMSKKHKVEQNYIGRLLLLNEKIEKLEGIKK